ncbi:metallophosphoesterase family protein [Niallia endozanthoxylica]|uniref:PhoD-like phosphatase metallophosphatase domain-containing protein n=1 Tax=Niallia endozanthoxylica TaxID=2036016 RepID=A0A5J5H0N4_9BACI|nr:hypothetical protein [Niallia endozanthoxylica]KAA9014196.1 hypothetical protein F4V44_24075 [Niallia endozanthoxylica]
MGFSLPTVLTGPLIRRVEPTQIFIWIATSSRFRIHAELFLMKRNEGNWTEQYLHTHSNTETIQFGKRLFIVTPAQGPFPQDQLLGYNLFFNSHKESFHLGDLGWLSPNHSNSIVYGDLTYPTFFMNSSEKPCRLLYGSCRKLHGKGEDTLALGDDQISQQYDHIEDRPGSLFLLGDQIYADDVPDPIIRVISQLGEQLIGQKEQLEPLDSHLNDEPLRTSIHQINGRQFIMENLCHFTSSSAANHLIEFGEYAVMYLLAWSPALWESSYEQGLFESFEEALENNHIHLHFQAHHPFTKKQQQVIKQLKDRYNEQQELLTTIQYSLYKVRRLLANIPSYMIFDDHDITDDWNISSTWRKNVEQAPLGKHVVANGLSAYWAFQGWGNDPDAFGPEFISIMNNYFHGLRKGDMHNYHNHWIELLWKEQQWHFITPTIPTAVVLDTRTKRDYALQPKPVSLGRIIEDTPQPPQLINQREWQQVTKQLYDSGWRAGRPLIVVSAPPVYGMGLIETFLHDYVYPLRLLGMKTQTTFDFEAWKYNGRGFTNFLEQAANWGPSECIILSGDVHYGSSVFSTVTFSDSRELKVKQFTELPNEKAHGFSREMRVRSN